MANKPSTRQKMINLMYLVFIAMMALNISTEILDGFDLLNENLQKAIKNAVTRNEQLYGELEKSYKNNPAKVEKWYKSSQDIKVKTDSLFEHIEYLKFEIAKEADGSDAQPDSLEHRDNIDAPTRIMISTIPNKGKGYDLKKSIDGFRANIVTVISDKGKASLVEGSLSTNPSERARKKGQDWVQASFENMPTVAVISYLTGIQASVKQAEGEALASILKNVDMTDIRVNDINAFVVPQSEFVMAGMPYKATIAVAAVDTTQKPRIFIGGKEMTDIVDGLYSFTDRRIGTHSFGGYLEIMGSDGSPIQLDFKQNYTVIEPMATIAPLMMDVLYANINNPLSISVPGVANTDLTAKATGGSLVQKGKEWIAKPSQVGSKFKIDVYAKVGGVNRHIASKEFRVRALPDPSPYILYTDAKGAQKKFKRGGITRSSLLNAGTLRASIDDGVLDITFQVISFRTVFIDAMKNAMPEVSDGANFSKRQLDQIQRMGRGKYFFISGIKAKGPDGVVRDLSPMELRLN